MIKAIGLIVKNVVIIVLLTGFLEMLLPNSTLKRFIKVVVGLFIMITVLNPLLNFWGQEITIVSWQLDIPWEDECSTVLAKGKKLSSLQQEQVQEEYLLRLEKQIEALIKLMPEVREAKCQVALEEFSRIAEIGKMNSVYLEIVLREKIKDNLMVQPVEIVKLDQELNQGTAGEKIIQKEELVRKIKMEISGYFNISEEKISVFLKN